LSLTTGICLAALIVLAHVRLHLLRQYPWGAFELSAIVVFLALVFVPLPLATFRGIGRDVSGSPPRDALLTLAARDCAHWLRRQAGNDREIIVASAASTATDMIYFGGCKGLGTFYWENRAGFHTAVDLHTAKTADEAYAILQQHKVTHWVIFSWDDFPVLCRGFQNTGATSEPSSFLWDLVHSRQPLPAWAHRLSYKMPFGDRLPQDWIAIFEILPPSVSGPLH
jgi:hypothetical protein